MPNNIKIDNFQACFVENENKIQLKWVWPRDAQCVEIVFLHRLGSLTLEDLARMSESERLGRSLSELCFPAQYRILNCHIYPLADDDIGTLEFVAFVHGDGERIIDVNNASNIIRIVGNMYNIDYSVAYNKPGRDYRSCIITINPSVRLKSNLLAYNVNGVNYPISMEIEPNSNTTLNPIIVGKNSEVSLVLMSGHDDEGTIRRVKA